MSDWHTPKAYDLKFTASLTGFNPSIGGVAFQDAIWAALKNTLREKLAGEAALGPCSVEINRRGDL